MTDHSKLITTTKLPIRVGTQRSVLFEPNMNGGPYSRKIYTVTDPNYTYLTDAHVHEPTHRIVVLAGDDVEFACKDENGHVVRFKLPPGYVCAVQPNVPHQLRIRGLGVVETIVESRVLTSSLAAGKPAKAALSENLFRDDDDSAPIVPEPPITVQAQTT